MESSTPGPASPARRRAPASLRTAEREAAGVAAPSEDLAREETDSLLAKDEKGADETLETDSKVALSRRSPMTVGKYNQWMLVDANRRIGEAIRAEESVLQRRREASTAAYHDARAKKTSVGRGQQELTQHAAREYRASLAKCGEQGRSELMNLRAIALRQKKEWAAHGARNAARFGLEQKKRVLEARAERFQTRRNAVLQTKNESAARKAAAQSATAAHLEDKKSKLERVRESIPDAGSLAEAREFFAKQKREAAAEVRSSVRGWESARKRDKEAAREKADAARATVLATRHLASENREARAKERQAMAAKIRAAIVEMESSRRQKLEVTKQHYVTSHREQYERKFVNDDAAARVDGSEYGQLVASTRMPGGSSTSNAPLLLSTASNASSPGVSTVSSPNLRPTPPTKYIPMPSWGSHEARVRAAPPASGGRHGTRAAQRSASAAASAGSSATPDTSWAVTDVDDGDGPTC